MKEFPFLVNCPFNRLQYSYFPPK